MYKRIDLIGLPGAEAVVDDRIAEHVLASARALTAADRDAAAVQIDVARVGTRARFSRQVWPHLGPVHAVLTRWYATAIDRLEVAPTLPGAGTAWSFAVTEHIGIERHRDWPDDVATPGLKHVSFLAATVPTAAFRAAYRHHVDLVLEHLPTMWRYVQNDVDRAHGSGADGVAAVSELSYRSDDDYERRWAKGPAGEEEFRSHEGFLDLPRTVTLLCAEHVLRSPAEGAVGGMRAGTR
jgi:hypothetical protein